MLNLVLKRHSGLVLFLYLFASKLSYLRNAKPSHHDPSQSQPQSNPSEHVQVEQDQQQTLHGATSNVSAHFVSLLDIVNFEVPLVAVLPSLPGNTGSSACRTAENSS